MRTFFKVLVLLLVAVGTVRPSYAADIHALQKGRLILSGKIEPGDAERFAVVVAQDGYAVALNLTSPGGDINESIRIAELVKLLHMSTKVPANSICASACFFVFLAGDNRIAAGTIDGMRYPNSLGYVGLHRPYLINPLAKLSAKESINEQNKLMNVMGAYLRQQNVPQRLVDVMMSRPSNDIYWLSSTDVQQLGNYAPALEELMIARCAYDRRMHDEFVEAKMSGDPKRIALADQRNESVGKCSATAFPDLNAESDETIDRLKAGWRPWAN